MKVNAKKALLIGLASSTLFGMTGCTVENNMEGDVYGPPPYLEDAAEDTTEIEGAGAETSGDVPESEKTL